MPAEHDTDDKANVLKEKHGLNFTIYASLMFVIKLDPNIRTTIW